MTSEQVERNRARQEQVYGEPLGTLLRRVGETLGLTQSRLAETIGLSAPMLSQLISAHRAKIGNPAVLRRVQELLALADEVREHGLDQADLDARIRKIEGVSGVLTPESRASGPGPGSSPSGPDPRSGVRTLQGVLRAVASADELSRAALRLDPEFPALAELLRVYGTGRTGEAQAHFDRVRHLV